ncbi:MAG: hypothetical protein PW789_04505 [Edaphobacter sp.]|uniref:hypothetical protein n=1 Tax=Edaphobacter sp. TaxID=1934404 RepID=UPI00239C1689|nr:hypothetical protein [Edaphobacter sp.]MDE1175849.1 hypothetical protein [Edaphobacter sp.]
MGFGLRGMVVLLAGVVGVVAARGEEAKVFRLDGGDVTYVFGVNDHKGAAGDVLGASSACVAGVCRAEAGQGGRVVRRARDGDAA